MRTRQAGLTTVEFAIAGSVALLILLGSLEVGRLLYVWNTMGEATRRAARLAAVCPMNAAKIKQAALLVADGSGSRSAVLGGFTTAKVTVSYLDAAGAATASYGSVQFVRVQISGYTVTTLVPFTGSTTLTVPPFTTTLPAESLGWVPELGTRTCL